MIMVNSSRSSQSFVSNKLQFAPLSLLLRHDHRHFQQRHQQRRVMTPSVVIINYKQQQYRAIRNRNKI